MATVMITCPTTKKPVPTGIAMDPRSFETVTFQDNAVRCPHCGVLHRWSKKDVYLEGD